MWLICRNTHRTRYIHHSICEPDSIFKPTAFTVLKHEKPEADNGQWTTEGGEDLNVNPNYEAEGWQLRVEGGRFRGWSGGVLYGWFSTSAHGAHVITLLQNEILCAGRTKYYAQRERVEGGEEFRVESLGLEEGGQQGKPAGARGEGGRWGGLRV